MSTKTIYIAGPMSGLPELNFPAFHEAAADLRAQGHEVVSPAELYSHTDRDWGFYMRAAIKAMMDCDEIFMLRGWANSKGAKIEWGLAQELEMEVQYQEGGA